MKFSFVLIAIIRYFTLSSKQIMSIFPFLARTAPPPPAGFTLIGALSKVTMASIKIGDCDIQPLKHVRNLGTWFDNHMSMNTHIGKVCSKAFRGLYNIIQIRKHLSAESTKCLIHAFVTSHLDYCNALLYEVPQYQYDRLQKVLNAAARVTCLRGPAPKKRPMISG